MASDIGDHPFNNNYRDHIMHYAGERYFVYMSEAQKMVSEFGEKVTTLGTEEETDSILPCSATLYLTSNNSIHTINSAYCIIYCVSYKVLS